MCRFKMPFAKMEGSITATQVILHICVWIDRPGRDINCK